MKFAYTARTQAGELQTGSVEAVNREAALNILTGHQLFILTLESLERRRFADTMFGFFNRVRLVDLVVFTRQFATLLEAKIPLSDALKTLARQTRNVILKEAVGELSADIDAGLTLSQALEKHGKIFSEFFVNMVRSAEVTGRMEEVMTFLADYLEKEAVLLSKVRNALIYPVIVVALFIIVAGLMLTTVIPQVKPIFEEAGVQLPFFTKILLLSGDFLLNWWWALIMAVAVLFFLVLDYLETEEGKAVFDQFRVEVPVIGNLFRKLYVARFAEALSVLLKGGVPVAQAIEIAGHTIGNYVYQDLLHEAAEGVRRGELLSQIFEKSQVYFPPLVAQMIAIGETTGRLDDMLSRISRFYSREVDNIVGNLVELIQPALMVSIGVLVGLLFASILLPLYDLAQAF
ncbi:MAG: Type II secretion system F domain protein [Parcubacteria group bacterium GW2011_GWA1_60_11]|nr:MAG: Type II secretion system F domain protein [Parcubacteria group bacterium GW2011_GWA1_60_11]